MQGTQWCGPVSLTCSMIYMRLERMNPDSGSAATRPGCCRRLAYYVDWKEKETQATTGSQSEVELRSGKHKSDQTRESTARPISC
jgi:hypothetical protein